jgi:hypothetical protein
MFLRISYTIPASLQKMLYMAHIITTWSFTIKNMWDVAPGSKKLPTPCLDRTDITPSLILNYGLHVLNADVLLPTAHKKTRIHLMHPKSVKSSK